MNSMFETMPGLSHHDEMSYMLPRIPEATEITSRIKGRPPSATSVQVSELVSELLRAHSITSR